MPLRPFNRIGPLSSGIARSFAFRDGAPWVKPCGIRNVACRSGHTAEQKDCDL